MTDPVDLLQSLVSIPSVNPMGRNVSGPEFGEARMTAFLEQWFADLGVQLPWIFPGCSWKSTT